MTAGAGQIQLVDMTEIFSARLLLSTPSWCDGPCLGLTGGLGGGGGGEGYKCLCWERSVVGHQRAVGGNCWAQHWGQCTAYCLLCLHPANTRPQHHRGDNGALQTNPHLLYPAGPLPGPGLAIDHSTACHSTQWEDGRDQDWEEVGQVGISHLPLVPPDPDAGDAVVGSLQPAYNSSVESDRIDSFNKLQQHNSIFRKFFSASATSENFIERRKCASLETFQR